MATVLGIDIGGSGIKGAPVDVRTGELLTERFRIPTPEPAKPATIAEVVGAVAEHFDWTGQAGVTFPAVVKHGIIHTAVNVDTSWIGVDADALFTKELGAPVTVLNDADAAGIGEMTFGAGKGRGHIVLMLTLGTGIGSALFVDGMLVRNTELGHLQVRGKDAERRAAASVRTRKDLTWEQWAERLNEYFAALEAVLWPDLIILGGGVSKSHDKFFPYLETRAELQPAQLLNDAGIVGAALAVSRVES